MLNCVTPYLGKILFYSVPFLLQLQGFDPHKLHLRVEVWDLHRFWNVHEFPLHMWQSTYYNCSKVCIHQVLKIEDPTTYLIDQSLRKSVQNAHCKWINYFLTWLRKLLELFAFRSLIYFRYSSKVVSNIFVYNREIKLKNIAI